jgi:AcrR family transcriptional regulator
MPLLIDSESRASTLVNAINHILAGEGPTGLSMRRIAAVSGVSTSSMLHHLGSREHMIRVAAYMTAEARDQDIESRAWGEGALAFLPACGDHVLAARVWLGWQELWRSEDSLDAASPRPEPTSGA